MDEQVLRAMARWPQVPAVFGWLRLDRRGGWHLIDRGQAGFDEARDGLGSPITSPPIVDFIHRNYTHDEQGRWYWQNGPQRVFVDLDLAPLVLRVLGEGAEVSFLTHTGEPARSSGRGWVGPQGEILLATDLGPGVVHDLDTGTLLLEEDEAGKVRLQVGSLRLVLEALERPPEALGFVTRPRAE
jgi:hypothetical protein